MVTAHDTEVDYGCLERGGANLVLALRRLPVPMFHTEASQLIEKFEVGGSSKTKGTRFLAEFGPHVFV